MWLVAAVFTSIIVLGGVYETWALINHKTTITDFVKNDPHLAIIVGGAFFTVLGYVLGVGGH